MGRKEIILDITENRPLKATIDVNFKGKPISEYFGINCFDDNKMKKFLSGSAYRALKKIIREGGKIDNKLAEKVAEGMKRWAISRGATHFAHWFQPLTGLTAEKHDSFLSFDRKGLPIEKFSGKNLCVGEPDASSFPSGGLRTTFEARGYTIWDPTSPAFLMESLNGSILCIPSVFLSYNGEALDKKTPLIRSMEKLSEAAVRILRLFGNKKVKRVWAAVGPEQEYFLVDKTYFNHRPDLILTGRTLFGAMPPKGQEMEDHYFGSIKERILNFMLDVEVELYKLGIPVKTRHNEVAPAQYEIAPIYEDCNIATDHNQIIMEVMRKVANRHNLALLLHEKPFLGINGSGKHNNWSLIDSEGNNLLEPGKTPHENLQFLTFLIATTKAVYKYADLLRASVATAGNDHRLGANEAPPAIISVFLGEQLTNILNNLLERKKTEFTDNDIIDLGINKLPVISKDNTDRNRTSPFAFTGNKFEFRAVGSSQSISTPNMTLNVMVCDVLNEFADKIEENLKKYTDFNTAVMEVIIEAIKETKPIYFEGNNYDPEWEKEAQRRGLPNYKTTPEALKTLLLPKNKELFIKYNVLSESEIKSRYNIFIEKYNKTINIEAETAIMMAKTIILPAVLKYQTLLANNIYSLQIAKLNSNDIIDSQSRFLNYYSKLVKDLNEKISNLENKLEKVSNIEDEEKKAEYYCKEILTAMQELRNVVDKLEEETDDEYWTLPKYREMLYIF
jgi:glutamine synthetase